MSGEAGKSVDGELPVLSIIVPTFNDKDKIRALVQRLARCLVGIGWEIVFVDDDSSDGTLEAMQEASRADHRVRFLHRIGRRGLSSAVVEGALCTCSPFLAVLDCDLPHDETILPAMLARLRSSDCDVVVGSRYAQARGFGEEGKSRRLITQIETRLARLIIPTKIADPTSGFFMIKRPAFNLAVRRLATHGDKVLLDIILSARPALRVDEIPCRFRDHLHGESKPHSGLAQDCLMLLIDKTFGPVIPARFVMFSAVGGIGVIVHMAVLAATNRALGYSFAVGQVSAAMTAMTSNFFLNNLLTYHDRRLQGFRPVVGGLLSFYAVCGIGGLANVGVAVVLFGEHYTWWLAGAAGVVVGAVWNYVVTSVFTWTK